jgi:fucose permease
MLILLLIIIYIAFISLGLPDSMMGAAWPAMYEGLGVQLSSAGIISMIISCGTILSSFFSGKIIRKLGTGLVTAVSVSMTALAMLGVAVSQNFIWFCICAIPLGLGAGSVDAALNNYVALHYKAMHMSWLHCFWGVGASLGPYIISLYLNEENGWIKGFTIVSIIQFALAAVLFTALPLWSRANSLQFDENISSDTPLKFKEILTIKGTKYALTAFFCYCAIEATTGLWGSTFLVNAHGISPAVAAKWVSLFYIGITAGRFISGFVTMKLDGRKMIRIGQIMIITGILLLIIPITDITLLLGLFIIGLGCAPIYPSMIHLTPENFGAGISQSVIGMQMACAYVGATFMPPLFGLIAQHIDAAWYPVYISIFIVLMIISSERLNKATEKRIIE